jgi:hypothetical protein
MYNFEVGLLSKYHCCIMTLFVYGIVTVWVFLCYYCTKKYHKNFGILANQIIPALILITTSFVFSSSSNYYYNFLSEGTYKNFTEVNIWKYGINSIVAFICLAFFSGWCVSPGGSRFIQLPVKCIFKYTPNDLNELSITKDNSLMWGLYSYKISLFVLIFGILLCSFDFFKFLNMLNILK